MSTFDLPYGAALAELIRVLDHFNVTTEPRQVALVFLEIAKAETERGIPMNTWLCQLAVDLGPDPGVSDPHP